MRIEYSEAAELELNQAIDFYNNQVKGLGYEFAAEVQKSQRLIETHPNAWTPLSPVWRRCRTERFPYGLIYTGRNGNILIVAVMHLARNPTKWQEMKLE